jgi:hypothetical protein
MRYEQFASHAYCRAAGPVSKMALRSRVPAVIMKSKLLVADEKLGQLMLLIVCVVPV